MEIKWEKENGGNGIDAVHAFVTDGVKDRDFLLFIYKNGVSLDLKNDVETSDEKKQALRGLFLCDENVKEPLVRIGPFQPGFGTKWCRAFYAICDNEVSLSLSICLSVPDNSIPAIDSLPFDKESKCENAVFLAKDIEPDFNRHVKQHDPRDPKHP